MTALDKEYESGLAAYIRSGAEEALAGAYELGRRAVIDGLGILDMAALHRAAIERIVLQAPPAEQARIAKAAAEYFNELMSPFEMSFRGYRTANDELRLLNRSLQQQKEAVEAANRELESFSHSVSHDLRGPLSRIDGFSELAIERFAPSLGEEGQRYLSYIRSSTKEMLQLIAALLDLSRVTRGEMQRVDVDLSSMAQAVCDRLQAASPKRRVDVHIEPNLHADADPQLLAIVMDNLVGNAWKYSSKRLDARIDVGREQRHELTVYYVRDNGAGFDMQHAGKLFGTFSRLHSASQFEGTGVGLATVQRVIHRHGGDIWAQAAVDAGATFYFTLQGGRRS